MIQTENRFVMQNLTRPTLHLPRLMPMPTMPQPVSAAAMNSRSAAADAPLRCLESASLLSGGKVVEIRHHDAVYRLSATRQGKLILTK